MPRVSDAMIERIIRNPACRQSTVMVMAKGKLRPSSFAGFLDLPGVADAWNYVQEKLREWSALPQRFASLSARAYNLSQRAKAEGKNDLANKVGGVITELTNVQSLWATTNDKLSSVLKDIKAAGFGIIPVVLGVALIAAVAVMVYVFKTVDYQNRVLDDVERGLLPPTAVLPVAGGGGIGGAVSSAVGGLLKPVALIGGAYLAYRLIADRRG